MRSCLALILLAATLPTAASSAMFNVSATGLFIDLFSGSAGALPDRTLTVTGSFEATDLNADGKIGDTFDGMSFITIDELGVWSFAISDASEPAFNFSISSSAAGAAEANSAFDGNTTSIGGVGFQNLSFANGGNLVQFDFFNNELRVQNAAVIGAFNIAAIFESTGFAVSDTVSPEAVVPLPAPGLLLLGALGAVGVAAGRRR